MEMVRAEGGSRGRVLMGVLWGGRFDGGGFRGLGRAWRVEERSLVSRRVVMVIGVACWVDGWVYVAD